MLQRIDVAVSANTSDKSVLDCVMKKIGLKMHHWWQQKMPWSKFKIDYSDQNARWTDF
jgi:hypothetical protein